MTEEHARRVHEASVALLAEPGVRLEHDDVCRLLLSNGARAGAGGNVVRLPEGMVAEALAAAPRIVTLCDQTGQPTVLAAAGEPMYWSCPGLYVWEAGARRACTTADLAGMARLLQRLPNVGAIFGMALEDVSPRARDVVGLRVIAENSRKHVRVLSFSPEGADALVRMRPVVGDWPWFSMGFTAHGPLRWTNLALEIFRRTAGHGIPVSLNGEPAAGVSGPVTLAGAATVGNAEILAALVVNQLLEPGRPVPVQPGAGAYLRHAHGDHRHRRAGEPPAGGHLRGAGAVLRAALGLVGLDGGDAAGRAGGTGEDAGLAQPHGQRRQRHLGRGATGVGDDLLAPRRRCWTTR